LVSFSSLSCPGTVLTALPEYDNDPQNPNADFRSAHDSAIFAHLRRTAPRLNAASRKSADYLGVSIPGEPGRQESPLGSSGVDRASHGSIYALRNPFGPDETVDEDQTPEGEDVMEVDLASWGLDSFIPKEKSSKGARSRTQPPASKHLQSLQRRDGVAEEVVKRRIAGSRSMSMGTMDGPGGAEPLADNRRRSFGSALDFAGTTPSQEPPLHNRHMSSHGLITYPPGSEVLPPHPHSPTNSAGPSQVMRGRGNSGASMGSRYLEGEQNPFSIRPPSPDRASRFDPKVALKRSPSGATLATVASRDLLFDDGQVPASRTSILDPRTVGYPRQSANMSLKALIPFEDDKVSTMTGYTGGRPYSTLELLRPKVLVMPSPLQEIVPQTAPPPVTPKEGFTLTSDGPPLPPGARSARRPPTLEPSSSLSVPTVSNAFTPNPRMSLTLSQLTFRNTLMVGGQRDVAYSDLHDTLPRATEDGEQIRPASPVQDVVPEVRPTRIEPTNPGRPPGRLYGKSLIDDLEGRKAQMRSKQRYVNTFPAPSPSIDHVAHFRVFYGDERPSMMARGSAPRSSTLIDPRSLQPRPTSQHTNSFNSQDSMTRRNSTGIKPLLSFHDEQVSSGLQPPESRMPKSRSVFGVDTLWEREMTKLHEIEAQERLQDEERKRREAEEEEREIKKKARRKGKGKAKDTVQTPVDIADDQVKAGDALAVEEPRISAEPPTLPAIPKASARRPPSPINDDDTDTESQDSLGEGNAHGGLPSAESMAHQWASDDDESIPLRVTGSGPRFPVSKSTRQRRKAEDDSDEDLPLAATLDRVVQRAAQQRLVPGDSDDEEQPLSVLLSKTKLNATSANQPPSPHPRNSGDDYDDDDQPLALRMSTAPSQSLGLFRGAADEDDVPLALHPERQRQTQYNLMTQQQQQMMIQAHFHNSMLFGPSPHMLGPGLFGPAMGAPMMMVPTAPMPVPSPPPLHDAVKYVRVDAWRHKVAVEGQE
jgi:hypothetical protein